MTCEGRRGRGEFEAGGSVLLDDLVKLVDADINLADRGLLLVGGGVGLTMGAPLQYLLLGLAPKAQAGPARTLLGTFRALGLAVGPVVYAGMLPAFTGLFLAAGIIAFLGLAATLPLWGMRPRPKSV